MLTALIAELQAGEWCEFTALVREVEAKLSGRKRVEESSASVRIRIYEKLGLLVTGRFVERDGARYRALAGQLPPLAEYVASNGGSRGEQVRASAASAPSEAHGELVGISG